MKSKVFILPIVFALVAVSACNKKKVTRIDPDTQIDLSGRWNDVDSKLVANEMITDVMERPWKKEFEDKFKRKAVVIIGNITNKTTEPDLNPETFIRDMEKAFINTGQVMVVEAGESREQLRKERADQQTFSTEESRKKWGREKGADFMMFGSISSTIDQSGKNKVVLYKVNLWLTDLESNLKVWIGDKEIKKQIRN